MFPIFPRDVYKRQLFTLPVDPTMGDSEKATNLIDAMDHYESGGESTIILSEADRWLNSITPETIGENAVPLESSRKTVSTDESVSYTHLFLLQYLIDHFGCCLFIVKTKVKTVLVFQI